MCSYSFALSGRFYCCTFVRRALPWADVSLPLRGVGSLTFRRICYPPELVPTPVPSPMEGGWRAPDTWLLLFRRIFYPPERVGACPLPPSLGEGKGVGVRDGCQAPSLWERLRVGELCSGMGWGGLIFVYRIIYPHTPRRVCQNRHILFLYSQWWHRVLCCHFCVFCMVCPA